MEPTYNKEKILESIFDPETSEILAELENGGKELQYLTNKLKISEDEIHEKLSYLIEHNFVKKEKTNSKIIFTADVAKLAEQVEQDNNFDNVIDGLAKMDSYLN